METLTTARLVLEPLVVAHAPRLFATLSDPAIHRYIDETPPVSVDALAERYARLERRAPPGGGARWLNWVLVDADGSCVGYVQATVEDGIAWVAWVLGSRWWGRGLATEAVTAMLDHLAAGPDVARFLATVDAGNARSIRLLERLGFTEADAAERAARRVLPADRLYTSPADPARRRAPT